MKTRKYVLFAALLLFGVLLFPSMASAHAYIVKSSPSENEVWKAPPKNVTIQFDEKIQPVNYSIQVFDEDGKRVTEKTEGSTFAMELFWNAACAQTCQKVHIKSNGKRFPVTGTLSKALSLFKLDPGIRRSNHPLPERKRGTHQK